MTLLPNFWSPCEISSKLVPGDALILVERSHYGREDAGQVDLHCSCQLVPLVECSFGSHDASDWLQYSQRRHGEHRWPSSSTRDGVLKEIGWDRGLGPFSARHCSLREDTFDPKARVGSGWTSPPTRQTTLHLCSKPVFIPVYTMHPASLSVVRPKIREKINTDSDTVNQYPMKAGCWTKRGLLAVVCSEDPDRAFLSKLESAEKESCIVPFTFLYVFPNCQYRMFCLVVHWNPWWEKKDHLRWK